MDVTRIALKYVKVFSENFYENCLKTRESFLQESCKFLLQLDRIVHGNGGNWERKAVRDNSGVNTPEIIRFNPLPPDNDYISNYTYTYVYTVVMGVVSETK